MRKLFTIIAAVLLSLSLSAQSPEKMSYQAVVRDNINTLVTNTSVGMQISILQGSASGTAVYIETQTPTTNANGLVSIEIGGGTVVSGTFANIDWANGPYFINTEIDPAGGTNYTITGTSQLLSVPYALHAKTAETVTGVVTETDPIFTAWDKDYSDLINTPAIPTIPTNVGAFTNDAGYLTSFTEIDPVFTAWDKDYSDLINTPVIPTVPTNVSAFTNDAGYLTSYTETDPLWTAVSSDYYTKTQMQTSGQSQLHWDNVTNKPTTLAGYGTELDPTWDGTNDETGNIFRTGKVSIGSSDTAALLYTYGDGTGEGNVLFAGLFKWSSWGNPPASGEGTRMMWYPDKGAFRVGYVEGANWDKDSIGVFSFAAGVSSKAIGYVSTALGGSTTASGHFSTAMGSFTTAYGEYSTAMGYGTTTSGMRSTAMGDGSTASGDGSTAMGRLTTASGYISTAMGNLTTASGHFSTAMGNYTTAPSFNEIVIGRYNTTYTPLSTTDWNAADMLFVIGNGTSSMTTSDAMVVLKNGNTGIGTSAPTTKLDVNGVITATGGNSTDWNTAFGWGNHATAGYLAASQTGNSGKFLTTDGSAASWADITKATVGLGNVENSALSAWAGSSNITTLGTITSGIWNGTPLGSGYIGDLDASKITSGIFDNARINWAAPNAIGSTTPAAGSFTSLSASSGLTASSGIVTIKPFGMGGAAGQVLTTDGTGVTTWAFPSLAINVVIKNANYTINPADGLIITNGGYTFTLPTASSVGAGKILYLYSKVSAITIVPASGNTFWDSDGNSTTVSDTEYSGVLISDGVSNWYQVSK